MIRLIPSIVIASLLMPVFALAAVNFDNTSSAGLTVTAGKLDTTTGLSIIAWIFPRTLGGTSAGRIFNNGTNGTNGYTFMLAASNVLQFAYGVNAAVSSSANAFNLGAWQCVGVTFNADNTNATFYVNGMPKGTSANSGNINTSTAAPVIGNRNAGDRQFDGYIANLKVWKRTLMPQEMRSQCYTVFPSFAGLMAWFPLTGVGPNDRDYGPNRLLATSTQVAIKNGAHRGPALLMW